VTRIVTTSFAGTEAAWLARLEQHHQVSAPELLRRGLAALYGVYVIERLPKKVAGKPGPPRGYRKVKVPA